MLKTPDWLGENGKKKWKELRRRLPALSHEDADSLALLCKSWESYLDAQQNIATNGQVQNVNGRLYPNPAVAISNESHKQIIKLSKSFGLSPETSGIKPAIDATSPLQDICEGNE